MLINIVGGGPSGLYFALLAKKSFPDAEVRVFERNPADATYGFGVVLADQGLQKLQAADADSFEQIVSKMEMLDEQVIHLPSDSVVIDSIASAGSIARITLLEVLQGCCRRAGVEMHFCEDIQEFSSILEADLVVAADGVNSRLRDQYAEQFGTTSSLLSNRFAWYGVATHYAAPALSFRQFQSGAFVGHYYRYQPNMSTFVAECDEKSWFGLGMDRMSDEERRQLAEEVFAEDLQGHGLIANNSMWRQFAVVQNTRSTFRNVVLLGDAQRSVHFSIGSGTRIAMEDAVALWRALVTAGGNVVRGLHAFEAKRRTEIAALVRAAEASYMWYEQFAAKMRLEPLDFAYDYMMRSGRMDEQRLRDQHPAFMRRYEGRPAGVASANGNL